MRLGRLAVMLAVMAMAAAGCSDSSSTYSGPTGFNRAHNSLDDYGRSSGYINPDACWRSTSTANCF